ncbi:MAG: Undecaprenyl-diphosphatase, partial [uncultured Nocardioidaceae bacterium]
GLPRRRGARDRGGAHRVPARLEHRPPHDRREAPRPRRRRPGGDGVHRGHPGRRDRGGARLLRRRHPPHRDGVVPRPGQARAPRRLRPPDGVVHHRGVDPDRRRRLRRPGAHHRPAALAVGGRGGARAVERGDGVRRAPGPPAAWRGPGDDGRRGRHGAGAVHRAGPGHLPVRRDDLGGAAARPRPGGGDTARVLPRGAVADRGRHLPAQGRRRHRRRGDGRRHAGELRRRLRLHRLAAQVRGRPQHRGVRALPRRVGAAPVRPARDRHDEPDL